eukprot:TRINITY_DN16072_c0_g1_i1.p1 TRINITY_DN16072_c0_g1~~TRINITY_DN16072_c0_g1_i1.p1  ORF type:complete len:103 (+),score=10.93 TRINITY_DN16072_c0_g1_i1:36-344(+)
MAEQCEVKSKLEQEAASSCKTEHHHYTECKERVENLDAMSEDELKKYSKRRGFEIVDMYKKPLDKDGLVQQLQGRSDCTHQWEHYQHCLDKHTAKALFAKLK